MPKKYTFEKKYNPSRETQLSEELNIIKSGGVIDTQEDIAHIGVKYTILMNNPDAGCLLRLTYFLREDEKYKRIEATVTSIYDTKPKVVEDLERILKKGAKVVNLK